MSRGVWPKAKRRLRLAGKNAWQALARPPAGPAPLLLIFGCQRSGTTLLTRILEKDWRSQVYGELGLMFDDTPRQHRLRPLPAVQNKLQRARTHFNVIKPLVESQRAAALLADLPDSKAVWLYRRFEDVAASNLRRFGQENGIRNLAPIVAEDSDDWRAQHLPEACVALVKAQFSTEMKPHDAAALFWYVRNGLFFAQNLEQNENIRTCNYATMVSSPESTLRALYDFIGISYPGNQILQEVHTSSVGKGHHIDLSAPIRELCEEMWSCLESANESRALTRHP